MKALLFSGQTIAHAVDNSHVNAVFDVFHNLYDTQISIAMLYHNRHRLVFIHRQHDCTTIPSLSMLLISPNLRPTTKSIARPLPMLIDGLVLKDLS